MEQEKKLYRVAHIITCLTTGGAEMMLYKIANHMHAGEFKPIIISLDAEEGLGNLLREKGISVYVCPIRRNPAGIIDLLKLVRLLRRLKPDLIQGWMYHGNIASTLASLLSGRWSVPVLWNIRQPLYALTNEKSITRYIILLGRWLSRLPQRILYNAFISAQQHEALGYHANSQIIANGFDTELFKPSIKARESVRHELGLKPDTLLIGMIARYHPVKNHQAFLQAAVFLHEKYPDVHFLLAGGGVTPSNPELKHYTATVGKYISMLGERQDLPRLTAALDISTLPSYWEAFPNVIGEAMACAVPCIASDVGDNARVIGDTGTTIPSLNSQKLAKEWQCWIERGSGWRQQMGQKARQRILQNYTLTTIGEQYQKLYTEVLRNVRAGRLLFSAK